MKLVFEVEIQAYGEDEEEQENILCQIRDTIRAVVSLADLSIGTFTTSRIEEEK